MQVSAFRDGLRMRDVRVQGATGPANEQLNGGKRPFSYHHQRWRGHRLARRVYAAAARPLTLHVGPTTLSFPLGPGPAAEAKRHLDSLLGTFAAKQAAERPKRWEEMEFVHKGDGGVDLFEVYCNPNAHSTAFDAKVMVTVKANGVAVTTEGRLTDFRDDLESYLAAAGQQG